MATIPQDPVTLLILSLPPTSLLLRAAVTITSGPHHLGNPHHPHGGRPFSFITPSPSPEFRRSLPPEGPITPTVFPGPLSASPYIFPATFLRLLQGIPPALPLPQKSRPAEGAASRTARAEWGGGGAAATVAFYEWGSGRCEASLLCLADARCAPARRTHWPVGPLTSPNQGPGAGRGG